MYSSKKLHRGCSCYFATHIVLGNYRCLTLCVSVLLWKIFYLPLRLSNSNRTANKKETHEGWETNNFPFFLHAVYSPVILACQPPVLMDVSFYLPFLTCIELFLSRRWKKNTEWVLGEWQQLARFNIRAKTQFYERHQGYCMLIAVVISALMMLFASVYLPTARGQMKEISSALHY